MGFDIWRRVGRTRGDCHSFDSRSGPRVDHGVSVGRSTIHRQQLLARSPRYGWSSLNGCRRLSAGRLRTKWVGIRTEEVFFRDTAHGLLAWSLATLLMATLVTLGSAATAGVAAATASAPSGTPVSPEAADQARKIAVAFAFTTSLSLLIGAFVASAAGALGGFHRDEA